MSLFISELFENPFVYFSTVVAFMVSICFHEFCHATVAHRLGDDTARNGGFQTLNPLKVMGWKSLLCLFLFGFSWGAVPLMPEDKSRLRRSAISLAGPLSNFLLLCLFSFVLHVLRRAGAWESHAHLVTFTVFLLYANAVLFLFNILPVPPLDGWGVLEPFLPKSLVPSPAVKGRIFMAFIYLVCFSSASGLFDKGTELLFDKFLPPPSASETLVAQGNEFMEAKDYSKAYEAFSKAADLGSVDGRLLLAACWIEGFGCEPDQERAFAELSKDDLSAYPLARFYLGEMLVFGLGCEQDSEKGYNLLSANDIQKNFPVARGILGLLLAEGRGTVKDKKRAYKLLDDEEVLAACPPARICLAGMLLDGEVCDKDAKRACSLLSTGDESEMNFGKTGNSADDAGLSP